MDTSDQTLIMQRDLCRDEKAFLAIVNHYGGLVYGTCRRIIGDAAEAEDVAQECFEFLALRGRKTETNLGAWLHRHATYRSLNRLRDTRRRKAREQRYAAQQEATPEPRWDDIYRFVDEAIDDLPEKLRVPVVERFLNGQSVEAIAAKTSVTRQTVHNRIDAGLDRIRKSLARRNVALSVAGLAALVEANVCEAAPAALIARLGRLALSGAATAPAGGLLSQATWAHGVLAVLIVLAGGAAVFLSLGNDDEYAAATTPVAREQAAPAPPPEPAAVEVAAPTAPQPTAKSKNIDVGVVHGVVMAENLTPVPGATVTMEESHPQKGTVPYHAETVSDQDGRFRFERLPLRKVVDSRIFDRATYEIKAETAEMSASTFLPGTHPLRETYLELMLFPNTSLSGTISGPGKEPVVGATVVFEMLRTSAPSQGIAAGSGQTKADHNGYFKLRNLFPGDYTLNISAPGYATLAAGPYATGAADLEIKLETSDAGCVVRGRVTDVATGEPLADCFVSAFGNAIRGYRRTMSEAKTDQAGEFALQDLLPDTYRISFVGPPYALLREPGPVVLEKPGQERVLLLEAVKGATVSGIVKDSLDGAGVANLEVFASGVNKTQGGSHAETAADGSFRLEGLAGGEYEVKAIDPATDQRASVKVTVEAGRDYSGVELSLPDRLYIAGVVLDQAGNPLADASVLVRPEYEEDKTPQMHACGVSDTNGAFKIPAAPTDVLYVQAVHEAGISRCVGPLAGDDARLSGLTLEIVPGARIDGVTVDSRGRPIENVVVLAVPQDANAGSFVPTPCALNPNLIFALHLVQDKLYQNAAGALSAKSSTFILYPLLPGNYTLNAFLPSSPADAPAASTQIHVAEGETITGFRLQLNTAQLAAVEGIVTREGEPVEGQCVEAICEDGRNVPHMTYTDREGRYHIANLLPGRASVVLSNARYGGEIADNRQSLTLPPGETRQADFHMAQGTAVVEGRVLVNGAPAANISVSFAYGHDVNNGVRATTDGQGNYRAENLLEGSYMVSAVNYRSEDAANIWFLRMTELELSSRETARLDWDIHVAGIRGTVAGIAPGEKGVVALFPHDVILPDLTDLTPEKIEQLGDLALEDVEVQDGKFAFGGIEPGEYVIGAAILPQADSIEDVEAVRYRFDIINVTTGQWLEINLTIP